MTNKILNVVHNDSDIAPLSFTSTDMINKAFTFDNNFNNEAHLFETSHGHIIKFTKKDGSFFDWQKGKPLRLLKKDLDFFASLDGFRWIEATIDSVTIGFNNTPD